ncbi:MAG: AAA family ATPase, partial [Saprospiraceae bacterium]|nr:AAA family ATPase [Saprospiraceae bacterium]
MNLCPKCHHQNPHSSNFCNNCGNKLSEHLGVASDAYESESKSKREAERRQLTILFCDLVGSTPLSQQLDPEDYRNMITNYHQVAEKVISSFGGYVAQYLGDGLLVYFGYPEGLEDAPKLSIQAGLGILDAMKLSNKDSSSKGFPPIQIRIGIHSGLVVVDDHLALGETVNIAARLEGAAPVNGLVISPKTLQLTQGWFNVESIGNVELKGIAEPLEVFQVHSETGALTRLDIAKKRGLSPFVGRESDLKLLMEQWKNSKNGKGQVVLLHGEAGIGKSRLVDTFEANVMDDANSQLIIARSSAYQQNSAFYPLIELLKSEVFKISNKLNEKEQSEKVISQLNNLFPDDIKFISLILEFLSIGNTEYSPLMVAPVLKRQMWMDRITQLLIRIGNSNPVCLIIEDLHWTDASTMEWLGQCVQAIDNQQVYIITTTRPIDAPAWIKLKNVTVQYLERLSVDETMKICYHQTKGKDLPKEILHQITIKTEGVPLFVEELTKMVLGSELLLEKEDTYEVLGSIKDISIPSTLQDSLLARLDRLSNVKEIVQMGSVLGREFSFSMMDLMVPGEKSETLRALDKLVNEEILYIKESGSDAVFQFKHALIQDAAYSSLLKSKRQQMHLQIAETLELSYDSLTMEQPQLLAFHYTEGGNYDKAVPLWLAAGQIFSQSNASLEAISNLENGLSLLHHINEKKLRNDYELDLLLTLGGMYIVSHGFPHPKVKETFNKAREVAQRTEISPKLALIMLNLLSYYMNTEDYKGHHALSKHMEE